MADAEQSVDSPSGSDQQQPQKRVRTSRPKVKTGCSVCKYVLYIPLFI